MTRTARLAMLLAMALLPRIAAAQDVSPNATTRLIQLLIQKGVLSQDQAASLLSQAQSESRAAARARPSARAGAASLATAEPPAAPVPPGTVRVTYVPQIVRDQIASEVREQVLGETERNGWAAPNALPEWTKRITVYGDLRARGEEDLLAGNKSSYLPDPTRPEQLNEPTFLDFNSINNGAPYDTAGSASPPLLNTTENRTRMRLRARIGVKATIDDWIGTDFRLATGSDNSPVSTNQTLGQGTNFGKYALWLDRAYIDIHAPPDGLKPFESLKAWIGRAPNPFWTTDLIFSDELNFDGVSLQAVVPFSDSVKGFANVGAFPVFNTDFNFSTNQVVKSASRDKYLFAGQVGADWQATPTIQAKAAAGLFAFSNIEGKLSSPCVITFTTDVCDTDITRTQFRQGGNTLFALRDIVQTVGATASNPQYFGLASKFDVLDLHARLMLAQYHPYDVTLEGEFVKNLAYNRAQVLSRTPVTNLGSVPNPNTSLYPYQGSDTGYMMKVTVGPLDIQKKNEWNVYFGYKYIGSDAVVDAFNDSNFHLGGTNAKGFFTGVDYGVAKGAYLAARWYSAREVSGQPYRNDVVQLDLNAKF